MAEKLGMKNQDTYAGCYTEYILEKIIIIVSNYTKGNKIQRICIFIISKHKLILA